MDQYPQCPICGARCQQVKDLSGHAAAWSEFRCNQCGMVHFRCNRQSDGFRTLLSPVITSSDGCEAWAARIGCVAMIAVLIGVGFTSFGRKFLPFFVPSTHDVLVIVGGLVVLAVTVLTVLVLQSSWGENLSARLTIHFGEHPAAKLDAVNRLQGSSTAADIQALIFALQDKEVAPTAAEVLAGIGRPALNLLTKALAKHKEQRMRDRILDIMAIIETA